MQWLTDLFNSIFKTSSQIKPKDTVRPTSTNLVTHMGLTLDIPKVISKGQMRYPKAIRPQNPMKARGKFKGNYPVGIVVHFTAGRSGGLTKALDSIKGGIKNGFLFACIADTGEFVQPNPMNEWGYHAGTSKWSYKNLFSGSVSDETFGIEINNAGMLTKQSDGTFKTWFNTIIPKEQVRHVTEAEFGCPTGYYHKYTPQQEKTLIEFCVWAIKNDPTGRLTAETILGHHEVAGKLGIGYFRKNDPGGALSMSMSKFRGLIKELCK